MQEKGYFCTDFTNIIIIKINILFTFKYEDMKLFHDIYDYWTVLQ